MFAEMINACVFVFDFTLISINSSECPSGMIIRVSVQSSCQIYPPFNALLFSFYYISADLYVIGWFCMTVSELGMVPSRSEVTMEMKSSDMTVIHFSCSKHAVKTQVIANRGQSFSR